MVSEQTCTTACDKRLSHLISYIHHTCDYKQYCHVGNTAKQCRLGLFQDSDFVGDLEDSKSTSGGTLCVFGSHTFVPISWMCKKQTSVSHSSTESEIISLDTGLRLDGLPALELWDLIVSVLGNVSHVSDRAGQPVNGKSKSYNKIDVVDVRISWMCKKQTSVSHRSTEAEIISPDAGLRMDVIPALDLWDLVIEVFHPNWTKQKHPRESDGETITFHPIQRILVPMLCCMSLRTTRQ